MHNEPPADPYKALGIPRDASEATIRSAYKKLMLQCHPDKVHEDGDKEEKKRQYELVREAYELLSDARRRRRYDMQYGPQAEGKRHFEKSRSFEDGEQRPKESRAAREREEWMRKEDSKTWREYEERQYSASMPHRSGPHSAPQYTRSSSHSASHAQPQPPPHAAHHGVPHASAHSMPYSAPRSAPASAMPHARAYPATYPEPTVDPPQPEIPPMDEHERRYWEELEAEKAKKEEMRRKTQLENEGIKRTADLEREKARLHTEIPLREIRDREARERERLAQRKAQEERERRLAEETRRLEKERLHTEELRRKEKEKERKMREEREKEQHSREIHEKERKSRDRELDLKMKAEEVRRKELEERRRKVAEEEARALREREAEELRAMEGGTGGPTMPIPTPYRKPTSSIAPHSSESPPSMPVPTSGSSHRHTKYGSAPGSHPIPPPTSIYPASTASATAYDSTPHRRRHSVSNGTSDRREPMRSASNLAYGDSGYSSPSHVIHPASSTESLDAPAPPGYRKIIRQEIVLEPIPASDLGIDPEPPIIPISTKKSSSSHVGTSYPTHSHPSSHAAHSYSHHYSHHSSPSKSYPHAPRRTSTVPNISPVGSVSEVGASPKLSHAKLSKESVHGGGLRYSSSTRGERSRSDRYEGSVSGRYSHDRHVHNPHEFHPRPVARGQTFS